MLQQEDRISIVRYRMENAHRTLDEVRLHIENGLYNTAVNRLYYACYYAVSALFVANGITTKSHDGVKQMFSMHYVKSGKVPMRYGRFYSALFDKRITGDYEDLFDHDRVTCEDLYPQAKEMIETLEAMAQQWIRENE